MKKLLLVSLLALTAVFSFVPESAFAAIARDVSSSINANSTTYSDWNLTGTWSHTTTGTKRILFCGIETQPASNTAEILTSVTYNGNAMTQLLKRRRSDNAQVWTYLYYILDSGMPTSGNAADVVTTVSERSLYSYGGCASYTGVNQVAPEASSAIDGTTSPMTITLTTIADNAWLVGFAYDSGGGTMTASTNTTEFGSILRWGRMFDTNAAQTPAGSKSMSVTMTGQYLPTFLAASIAPDVPVVTLTSILASILDWFEEE